MKMHVLQSTLPTRIFTTAHISSKQGGCYVAHIPLYYQLYLRKMSLSPIVAYTRGHNITRSYFVSLN